ncbi:hypothetical protein HGRIS_011072 [Hohenbuehelia grisea]|uniref:Zn(2)-C6 fungal-type domain-containing protein n=1 Tax=Hohenbuehelia grisea TaxID=104357 RepID=A0ABR3IZ64_9AGAR
MSHPAPIFPAAHAGIASSPTSPSPRSSPGPPSPHPDTSLFLPPADPASEVDEINSLTPDAMDVENPTAVLVVPEPGVLPPAAAVEPRQAADTTVLPSSSLVVDPLRSPEPLVPSAEEILQRRQADLAHREWRVEVKSVLSDHQDFASRAFLDSFPVLWNRGVATFPHPQDAQEQEWRTKVLKATLPFLLRHRGAGAVVRQMDPTVHNLLNHLEESEQTITETMAAGTGHRDAYKTLEQQVRDRTRELDRATEATDAVEALAHKDAKARGLKGSAIFKFVGDRVAAHETKIEALTKDLASLGEDLDDLSLKIANVKDDLATAKQIRDDFRHELFEVRYPLPAPPAVAPSAVPVPKKTKAPKTKGKGKPKMAASLAPESPPPRSPSPVSGPSKCPAPASDEDSEPIATCRTKRSKPAPEDLFLPPLSDSDVVVVEAKDSAPVPGPSKPATRSQMVDKGKKASGVVLKVPAPKAPALPFAKDVVASMPFYACTRCLRLGRTCKRAPDCKACRGCQRAKIGCEEGTSGRCLFDATKMRRVYDAEAPTAVTEPVGTTAVPRPFLLPPLLVPGHSANTAAVFHEQAEYHMALVRSLEEQCHVAWLAAYRNKRLAEEHRRLDSAGFTELQGTVGRIHLAGLPITLPGDSGHRLHLYLDRLEAEEGQAWLHSVDVDRNASGDPVLGAPATDAADDAEEADVEYADE